ncbi:MAG: hypothetical protein FD180_889 [Planctomycetota bacterium]|nr:MAG: hypothetical protein FD180_889 [Planctomycetota bacterium]
MKNMLRFVAAVALTGGLMVAGEPGGIVRVDLRDVPLAEALGRLEKETGRKFEYTPGTVESRRVDFVKSGTVAEVLAAFATTLEVTESITLVPGKDGAHKLLPFTRKPSTNPRPVARSRRLAVDVVEGTVMLFGGQGSVAVRAGERSWVYSGSLPAAPVPCDPATVALWRMPEALSASSGLQARVPLPEIRFQLLGYTESGQPIVEYEVNGARCVLDFGTLDIPEEERRKIVIENGELVVPINVRVQIPKAGK